MPTHTLQLLFVAPRKRAMPGTPSIAQVGLKTWAMQQYRGREIGPVITPQCVTIEEFSAHVKRLKAELDTIHEQAKRRFAGAETRRRSRGLIDPRA